MVFVSLILVAFPVVLSAEVAPALTFIHREAWHCSEPTECGALEEVPDRFIPEGLTEWDEIPVNPHPRYPMLDDPHTERTVSKFFITIEGEMFAYALTYAAATPELNHHTRERAMHLVEEIAAKADEVSPLREVRLEITYNCDWLGSDDRMWR